MEADRGRNLCGSKGGFNSALLNAQQIGRLKASMPLNPAAGGDVGQFFRLQLVEAAAIHAAVVQQILGLDLLQEAPDISLHGWDFLNDVAYRGPGIDHEIHVAGRGPGMVQDETEGVCAVALSAHISAEPRSGRTVLLRIP